MCVIYCNNVLLLLRTRVYVHLRIVNTTHRIVQHYKQYVSTKARRVLNVITTRYKQHTSMSVIFIDGFALIVLVGLVF